MKAREGRWGGANDLPPAAEDDLATAEARVIEWAIARQTAAEVSWHERDRATAQLDIVTRALIRLRGKG